MSKVTNPRVYNHQVGQITTEGQAVAKPSCNKCHGTGVPGIEILKDGTRQSLVCKCVVRVKVEGTAPWVK